MRAGNGIGRNQLNDAQSIFAVRDERELRRINATDLHRPRIVQRAARIEHLIDERPPRIFNIDNGQSFRPVRDIGISAGDIQAARMLKPHSGARNRNRSCRFRKIDYLHPVIVSNESVAELDCDTARIAQETIR